MYVSVPTSPRPSPLPTLSSTVRRSRTSRIRLNQASSLLILPVTSVCALYSVVGTWAYYAYNPEEDAKRVAETAGKTAKGVAEAQLGLKRGEEDYQKVSTHSITLVVTMDGEERRRCVNKM